jgi:hypothetical protein
MVKINVQIMRLKMTPFEIELLNMNTGDRITSGDKSRYGYEWEITRVPSGWIYVLPKTGHCVFVPYDRMS